MFTSGWAPTLGGPFMLTTELISIPTGVFFLVMIGTLWRGHIWMKLPTVWMFGFMANFVIGGVTGIYLSDIPLDDQLHGTMFVTAHFHYIFVGSVLFGAIAALAFWFPKVTGRFLSESLGRVSFWLVFIGVQITFLAMFISGLKGMPRRVASYSLALRAHELRLDHRCLHHHVGHDRAARSRSSRSWNKGEPAGPNPGTPTPSSGRCRRPSARELRRSRWSRKTPTTTERSW